ncbi:MAG TPA: methionine synthase [Candidatus Dormibacteraeota bacterium]|jgi:5-methyltetrahydropteroyltriglutamate--homocysteine methyltransferase|nr:methionine synthase [Candidatus Dormibacteraeota bacterium]
MNGLKGGLLTTSVGSLPKPPELIRARSQAARGQISVEELDHLARQATRDWITFQEQIGMDILVDGEMYRGDMVAYFAENLEGMGISGLVRSYGNRYYKKPIAIGPIRRPAPITVDWWRFAQSLTERPVKGMLTGPYTLCDWAFDDYYGSRRELVMALAEAVRQEAEDLQRAGAKYIQIDEPAVSTRLDELDLAIEGMALVTKNLHVHTTTHMCYGRFETVYPRLLDIPVDEIDLEMTNSGLDLLERFREHPFTKDIGFGVVDVHSHQVPSVEEVKDHLRRALDYLPADRVYVDPDCGLKTRSVDEAKAMLTVIQQARDEVRAG